uniref:Uncharacterized protein n=1 Tax=Bracon brevicornis TaxID=1563983 RepID=A0A6V7JE72_9HYME
MNGYVAILFAMLAVANAGLLSTEQVPILAQELDVHTDGSFVNTYQTGNGISVQEQGYLKQVQGSDEPAQVIQGSVQYTAPDGTVVSSNWDADENGARYEGSHKPVAPPVPANIQRALEYIAAHTQQVQEHVTRHQQPQYNRRF